MATRRTWKAGCIKEKKDVADIIKSAEILRVEAIKAEFDKIGGSIK